MTRSKTLSIDPLCLPCPMLCMPSHPYALVPMLFEQVCVCCPCVDTRVHGVMKRCRQRRAAGQVYPLMRRSFTSISLHAHTSPTYTPDVRQRRIHGPPSVLLVVARCQLHLMCMIALRAAWRTYCVLKTSWPGCSDSIACTRTVVDAAAVHVQWDISSC